MRKDLIINDKKEDIMEENMEGRAIVAWPDSQDWMGYEGFAENSVGTEEAGTYLVDIEWAKEKGLVPEDE